MASRAPSHFGGIALTVASVQLCRRLRYRCSNAPKFEGFRARCSDGRRCRTHSMLSFQTLLLLLACASSHASQGAVHLVEDDVEVLGSSVLLSTLDDPDSTTLVDPEAEASALSDDDDEASSASATPLSFLSSLFAPSWLPDDDDHTSFRRPRGGEEEAKEKVLQYHACRRLQGRLCLRGHAAPFVRRRRLRTTASFASARRAASAPR